MTIPLTMPKTLPPKQGDIIVAEFVQGYLSYASRGSVNH
jgi:hypothetical protein